MANRLVNPFPQFWSSSAAYSGGTLNFYASGTDTPLAVYSDKTLSSSIGTSVTLNSAGRYTASDIFLQNVDYKVVLKDSDGVTIWTADPVRGSDFTKVPLWSVGSGSPNGSVAGTAGSSGVMPSVYWDYTNSVLYLCTTTGTSSTAVWTAVNASASTPSVPPPQGRLTLVSGTPVISTDQASKTAVYYTPYVGTLVPIYNGASMTPTEFAELTLTLASQHSLSTIYDVFVFSNSGVLTLVTGPAWNTSTAGSGSRSTGASTTELTRVKGFYVNAVQIAARNGATTYTIAANLATYLGSIFIDGTAGQVTCHVGYGQSRKWGVWNAYNRLPIVLKAGDATASWTYTTATIRASNGSANNSMTVFSGLAEESYDFEFNQRVGNSSAGVVFQRGIGFNSTTAFSGFSVSNSIDAAASATDNAWPAARYQAVPSLGINTVTSLEHSAAAGTTTWQGTEAKMLMTGRWRG